MERKCILGEILREENLTQTKLAEISGVPQSAVSRYSKGQSRLYDINHLFALAKALDRSIEDLFAEEQ
ncbi:helix-turn-helix domain-containing protein [Kroppenstedtia eburnea]|uniref:Helix-turn-helix n=1 Tax=Kroppenstedtia eburnea TaxID=714067 RepID=A0A1N7JF93_9BACL|nr:helix-turn-helix transcriptional regulator [Kroppenstedtia eburnea]QKI80596.1 helix-turn-helix transcriptional regulator [Kroppenstedtia eburnea]SIS48042.1 Helix-turn-helix [Kroppenstedtia eburnea]